MLTANRIEQTKPGELNLYYVRRAPGILKILQIICGIIGTACASNICCAIIIGSVADSQHGTVDLLSTTTPLPVTLPTLPSSTGESKPTPAETKSTPSAQPTVPPETPSTPAATPSTEASTPSVKTPLPTPVGPPIPFPTEASTSTAATAPTLPGRRKRAPADDTPKAPGAEPPKAPAGPEETKSTTPAVAPETTQKVDLREYEWYLYSTVGAIGQGWVLFVGTVCIIMTFLLLSVHLFGCHTAESGLGRTINFPLVEFIFTCAALLLYMISFAVEAWYSTTGSINGDYVCDRSPWRASATFVFFAWMLYGAGLFYHLKYRGS